MSRSPRLDVLLETTLNNELVVRRTIRTDRRGHNEMAFCAVEIVGFSSGEQH